MKPLFTFCNVQPAAPHRIAEYLPPKWSLKSVFHSDLTTYEIETVNVHISKNDWERMVDVYNLHLPRIKNPAVKDAWDQYVATVHLTGAYYDT